MLQSMVREVTRSDLSQPEKQARKYAVFLSQRNPSVSVCYVHPLLSWLLGVRRRCTLFASGINRYPPPCRNSPATLRYFRIPCVGAGGINLSENRALLFRWLSTCCDSPKEILIIYIKICSFDRTSADSLLHLDFLSLLPSLHVYDAATWDRIWNYANGQLLHTIPNERFTHIAGSEDWMVMADVAGFKLYIYQFRDPLKIVKSIDLRELGKISGYTISLSLMLIQ